MSFLNFVVDVNNSLWIDFGFFIFILLVLAVLYLLRPFYFHYLGSTLFIGFGFLILFWPLINKELNLLYSKLLAGTTFSTAVKEFILYLKFNVFLSKLLFFSAVLFIFFIFTNIFYFAFFRRKFSNYYQVSGKKLFLGNLITKFFAFIAMMGVIAYLATPFYLISNKNTVAFVKQSKSYLNAAFNEFAIADKYTNLNNNPLKPIWNDLLKLQDRKTTDKTFQKSFKKVNSFFSDNFNYFYRNKWLILEVKKGLIIANLLKPATLNSQFRNKSDFQELKDGFRVLFDNYSRSYFILLPKIV